MIVLKKKRIEKFSNERKSKLALSKSSEVESRFGNQHLHESGSTIPSPAAIHAANILATPAVQMGPTTKHHLEILTLSFAHTLKRYILWGRL